MGTIVLNEVHSAVRFVKGIWIEIFRKMVWFGARAVVFVLTLFVVIALLIVIGFGFSRVAVNQTQETYRIRPSDYRIVRKLESQPVVSSPARIYVPGYSNRNASLNFKDGREFVRELDRFLRTTASLTR